MVGEIEPASAPRPHRTSDPARAATSALRATAVVAQSSLAYLEQVFALHAASKVLVNVSSAAAARGLTGLVIEEVFEPGEGGGWFTAQHPLVHDERPAQISYTSGTEGLPKGIVLTHANLADATERIIAELRMTAEVREYVGVPVTHSFGFGRVRAVAAVGGRAYLPPRGFDPLELARMLEAGEINSLSAVPTLLRVLLGVADLVRAAGPKLRWMEIGSQPMTAAEKLAVRELFPNARIVQHYGLTEASRSTFLRVSEVPEALLESVGRPTGATELTISPEGRIRIRGPHVAQRRIEGDRLVETRDAEGWLSTGDLGSLRDGYLYFEGRADDLINCGGLKINPDQAEARLRLRLGAQHRVVVTRVPDAMRGEGVLVVAESAEVDSETLRRAANEVLKELGLDAGAALHTAVGVPIPTTATGKASRRALSEAYVRQRPAAPAPAPAGARAAGVLGLFQETFPGSAVSPQDTFESLGGDSLTYIQFSMQFEKRFGRLPDGWASTPIARLEASAGQTVREGFWRRLESTTLTRAFFMTCIVALHLDALEYSTNWGAAYFLYMLAGYAVIRFQWPEVDRSGRVVNILKTVARVAVPTVLVTAVMQLRARTFELKPLLLISNYFDPAQYQVAFYYFAEVYMQLLLLAALALSVPAARRLLRAQPLAAATVLLVTTYVGKGFIERVWDTTAIFHRTPHWYAWTMAAGVLMASARSLRSRVYAMIVVSSVVYFEFGHTSAAYYIWGGCALVLFWPEITVPGPVKTAVSEVASSSMFMYLSHLQVQSVMTFVLGRPRPWPTLLAAMVVGVLFARAYGKVESRMRALRSRWVAAPAQ